MIDSIGFIVSAWIKGESGRFHAIGRCGDQSIRVGDVFNEVYLPSKPNEPIDLTAAPCHQVRLSVISIQAYQRDLPVLGEGMTGTIDLEGSGIEHIAPGAILGGVVATTPDDSAKQRSVSG